MEENAGILSGMQVQQNGKKLWQYISASSACFLAIGVGTALAWTSPILPHLQANDSWLPITEEQASWISSFLAIGAMIGALPSGAIAHTIGYKHSFLLLSIPFFVSWIIIIFAKYVWMLYIARFIVGIAVGASCVLVPTYLSEIGESSIRGTLGAMFQLFLTIGIVFAFVMGATVNYIAFAIACSSIEVILVATFLFMPESPVWLISQNRKIEASKALRRLRGKAYDITFEITKLQKESEESISKSSIIDILKLSTPRKALFICLAEMVFQQLSGINAVIFYTIDIFEAVKSSVKPDFAAVLVSFVQFFMSAIAAGIIDKVGRKPLLIFSSMIMSCSLITLGLFFKLQENEIDTTKLGWLPLASLVIFMIAFSVGMGPIPWILMAEFFTVELKGNASSLAVMLNWFLVFFVTKTFPTLKTVFNVSGTFWIFAVIMALATIFTFFFVLETKGKTIQEIQDELSGKKQNRLI